MRAWQTVRAGAPKEALALCADAPEPVPYPGTVLLEVHAAGLGLPDALMCQGSYAMTPKLPFTQGQEVVGVIPALSAVDADIMGRPAGVPMLRLERVTLTAEGETLEYVESILDPARLTEIAKPDPLIDDPFA